MIRSFRGGLRHDTESPEDAAGADTRSRRQLAGAPLRLERDLVRSRFPMLHAIVENQRVRNRNRERRQSR